MKRDQENNGELEVNCQLAGWMLFVLCAIVFIAASLKNQDMLTLAGSVIFLMACIVFLIPLLKALRVGKRRVKKRDL
jgi:hypothetical protein